MSTAATEVEKLVAAVAELMKQPATLVENLSFSNRAVVARVLLASDETVVAKKPTLPTLLANEVEALRVLPPTTRPTLISSGDGIVVMEDLGTGPSVADLLLGADRRAAERALLAWARTLGSALASTLRTGAAPQRVDLTQGAEQLVGFADDLGVQVPPGVGGDVRSIEDLLSAESPWLAFCPGDTCPDNNRVLIDGSVRFFDFEGAGWRHTAAEAAYCRAPFCTCWCVAALPHELILAMERDFVEALLPPNVEDFRAAVGLAAVSWTLLTFGHFRRFVMDGAPTGPPDRAPSNGRQHVLLRLATVQAQADRIPALAELAGQLTDAIVRQWPNSAERTTYPAFR